MQFRTLALAAILPFSALAQKRPLTHGDYDSWRGIQSTHLSADGAYLGYALFPQDGDGEFVLRNLKTGKEWREPVGARPPAPPPNRASLNPEEPPPQPPSITVAFSKDSRVVVFSTFTPKAEVDQAHREKKKPEERPKNGMVIPDIASGTAERVPRAKSLQAPEDVQAFMACCVRRDKQSD